MEGRIESERLREELSTSSFRIGIGVFSSSVGESVIRDEKRHGFTPAQLHELQQQSIIYKHIVSGISVPIHLVLPVLRSVARTLEISEDGIYKLYPSFIGFGHQGFDYSSIMDPEPGRCRRTDGKKWRCKKKTVPDQKYCEQHMHRGRQRSRKLVEASGVSSSSNAIHSKNLKGGLENSALNLSASRSTNFSHCTTSPTSSCDESKGRVSCTVLSITSNAVSGTITIPASISANSIPVAKAATSVTVASAATAAPSNSVTVATAAIAAPSNCVTVASAATTSPNFTRTKSMQNSGKDDSRILDGYAISRNCIERDYINVGQNLSLGLGLSPKTVLQVVGCNGVCLEKRSGSIEFDQPGRCRRTDGKKWRCSRDTIPDQKYCARHMHRGVKKRANVFLPTTDDPSASADNTALLPPTTATSCGTDGKTPNTSLSISMPASSLLVPNDEKSTSSSSSDTTITDTSFTANAISNVSS